MEGLLTMLLSEKLGLKSAVEGVRERNPEVERLREQIRQSMIEKPESTVKTPTNGGSTQAA